jgi:hypothetical protein
MGRSCGTLSLLSVLLFAAQTPTDSLIVEGAGKIVVLRANDVTALPHETVQAKIHDGTTHSFSGVPISVVLAKIGIKTDSLRGKELAQRLVVEASDGYKVAIALGEIDVTLGHRKILLVAREDGEPLPAADGAWRLIVPDDGRPARSAHLVIALRVRSD